MGAVTVKVALEVKKLRLQISRGPEEGAVQTFAPNGADQARYPTLAPRPWADPVLFPFARTSIEDTSTSALRYLHIGKGTCTSENSVA